MKQIIITLMLALGLTSCSPRTNQIIWVDQYGEQVPITVTQNHDTTVYDFGTIIMYEDTTYIDTLIR
jgi:hypothetical protein